MKALTVNVRRIGNSLGVVIPKPVLAQVGLSGQAHMTVEHGAIVLRKPSGAGRSDWSEAAVIAAPMTSKGCAAPFRAPVTHAGTRGLIVLDQIRAVDQVRLSRRLGSISPRTLSAVLGILQDMFAQ